ncbi:MAG TPA: YicC family protein [Thiobacillaceae bacterium]|nr:YicC family protein [Thiobacillaceae bacterium]
MTGYAVETTELAFGHLSLELRAVNSRFLDLSFRMAEDFRHLEPQLRERIAERVKRGKLECRINYTARDDLALSGSLNATLLEQLAGLAEGVRLTLPDTRPLSVAEVLRWPGMLGDNAPDQEALDAAILHLASQALQGLNAARAREGEKLKDILLERVGAMRGHLADIAPRTGDIVAAFRDKLTRRMEDLLASHDTDRLHQEVALFAQRIDVDEELDRLDSHLTEVERVLAAGGAAGKRLDFLMQELNREANTLASKAAAIDLTRVSVELKVLIEQMREQVQNLE